jgi:pyruvate dehydrogenase (quinone)
VAGTVADFIWERLQAWGVRRVYGYPGDGIGGLIGALARSEGAINFVQVRHEEMAGLMACGHAKFTGEVGVCIATSGPGAIHLLNGLYDAKLDHQPVLALVGQQARSAIGSHYQQDLDLQSLFKDVAGAYVETAFTPVQVRHLIDRAYRIAKAERQVTCVILPNDLQQEAMEQPAQGARHDAFGRRPRALARGTGRRRRSRERRRAQRGRAGGHAGRRRGARRDRRGDRGGRAAQGQGSPRLCSARPQCRTTSHFARARRPSRNRKASSDLMRGCDTLLMVGSGFPYTEFLPKEGQPGACRSTSTPACSACATPWR